MFLNNKKWLFLLFLLVVVLGASFYWFNGPAKDRAMSISVEEKVVRPDLNFSFSFLGGVNALSYTESAPETLTDNNLLKAFVLMETKRQRNYLKEKGASVPPAITILIFRKTDFTDSGSQATSSERLSSFDYLAKWTDVNSGYTGSRHAVSDYVDTEIDGRTALNFQSELGFKQDTYVARYRDKVYLFVGQYEQDGDFMQQAFKDLIASVRLE